MNKKIFIIAAIFAFTMVSVVNYQFNALFSQNEKSASLLLSNIQALADFEFNGQDWDTEKHWYNFFGSNWKPVKVDCTKAVSTGFSVSVTVYGVGVGIGVGGTVTTTSGHKVECQNGDGNCWEDTECISNPSSN